MTEPRTGQHGGRNAGAGAGPGDETDGVIIRDKRKIDPVTGAPRPAPATDQPTTDAYTSHGEAPAFESGQTPMVDAALLDERTNDLQRLQAEYANYRRRAERERLSAGDAAISRVLSELLPVFI